MRIRRVLLLAAFMVFFVLVMAMNASAALVTTFDHGNAALIAAGYTGPYANVDITLGPANTATVEFVALNGYLLGGSKIAAVNVNATSFEYSPTSSFTKDGTPGWTGGSPGTAIINARTAGATVSEFGSYNLVYDSHGGLSAAVQSLTFVLTNTSDSIWDSPYDVLAWDTGWAAAGHIFTTSGITGFAGDSPVVPLPSTLLLLGSGLAGLVGIGRFRRKRSR